MAAPSPSSPLRLREWLVAQVESGRFPGLCWEDRARGLFRIPWKHAAKQDYRQRHDAALFKAWAVYKGKYHEGQGKADPSVWKTRLRCALNKSTDFQEIPERSHLDISEPYKVYQVVTSPPAPPPESQQETDKENSKESLQEPNIPATSAQQEGKSNGASNKAGAASSDSGEEGKEEPVPTGQDPSGPDQASPKPVQVEQQGLQVKGFFYGCTPAQLHCHKVPHIISPGSQCADVERINSDSWLHIRLYYCNALVKEVTTGGAEGCRLTFLPVPAENPCLFGPSGLQEVQLPLPSALPGGRGAGVLGRLLPHLHRGVLLWVAPEGVFAKRQCQGRVYWRGPLAPHPDRPNKLEREKTYKLLDAQHFRQQLEMYKIHGAPAPQYEISLCFGEEYPAAPNQKFQGFIMAHVEPVFARDLFLRAQQSGARSLQNPLSHNSDASRDVTQILKQMCSP